MTKEELKEYAAVNRSRLEKQMVALGDVVKILVGNFAGERGVVKGMMVIDNDFTDPYYEVEMECEVPDEYKCRKTLLTPNNVIGGVSAYEFEVIGNRAPVSEPTPKFKVGDKVKIVSTNNIALQDKVGIVAEKPEGVSSDLVEVEILSKSFTYLKPCQLVHYARPTATDGEKSKTEREPLVPTVLTKPLLTIERARKEMAEIDREMRDPEKRKQIDEEWNKMLAEKKGKEKEHNVSETVKDAVDWMRKLDKAVEKYKTAFSEICSNDWQHYRMELAKAIASAMIGSNYQSTMAFDVESFCNDVVAVVDGIVERLKNVEQ